MILLNDYSIYSLDRRRLIVRMGKLRFRDIKIDIFFKLYS